MEILSFFKSRIFAEILLIVIVGILPPVIEGRWGDWYRKYTKPILGTLIILAIIAILINNHLNLVQDNEINVKHVYEISRDIEERHTVDLIYVIVSKIAEKNGIDLEKAKGQASSSQVTGRHFEEIEEDIRREKKPIVK